MPETEALLSRFRAAHTQVLGVSVDSVFSHANWGKDLGGVSFPLLSDFSPKGAVARAYDMYLDGPGITDRATVLIDASGKVVWADSATPAGRRDVAELAARCEKLDQSYAGPREDFAEAPGIGQGGALYVKSGCGPSRAVLLARANLHLDDVLSVRNISECKEAKEELLKIGGKDQAPCLVRGGEAMYESADIVKLLVEGIAPL